MSKVRVYQLAKELGLDSKELLHILADLGVKAQSHSSSIDEESAKLVKDLLKEKETKSSPAAAAKPEENKTIGPKPETEIEAANEKKLVELPSKGIIVRDLAEKLELRTSDLIREIMSLGILATINQRLNISVVNQLAARLNFEIIFQNPKPESQVQAVQILKGELALRPPVVVIMGHVDHGKTKLLDVIRKTNVINTEAGGITQHIGAYQVKVHDRQVTFLDTPGHEAFTTLRARGAQITDLAVLVVAADDGIMPQTIEAIHHARAAKIPIIVAINKIDKPEANVDKTKQQLVEQGLVPEDWGGDTVTVQISAKQETGLDHLLEMILLVADLQELKASFKGVASGVIIESKLDRNRGPVATLLIKSGILRLGDAFVIDDIFGKVRAMLNDKGKKLKEAGPATPVEIFGITEVPQAGGIFQVFKSEREAKEIAFQRRSEREFSEGKKAKFLSLEDFSQQVQEGMSKNLNLILKTDVHGSLEAILKSVQDLTHKDIKINVIHAATGLISESDIMLAKASEAVIIGFNLPFSEEIKVLAEKEGVEVKIYDIIYQAVDDIKSAMEGMLSPEYEEVPVGKAEIRTLFKFSKIGNIAGCFVIEGKIIRGGSIRIKRDKKIIYEGKLDTLRRFKDDVKEAQTGFECGITLNNFGDFAAGDIVEAFEIKAKPRKLKINV